MYKKIYKKILIALKVIQVADNEKRNKEGLKRMGEGYFKAYRFNPFNPLSYVIVIGSFLILLILHGFVGLFENAVNPFRWN